VRLGGDEFAVVLTHPRSVPFRPLAFAERLIAVLRQPYRVRGRTLVVGASVGVAACPAGTAVPPDLLYQAADRSLYDAKASGRGVARARAATVPSSVEAPWPAWAPGPLLSAGLAPTC
jgi:diguanylate cyclase (GGDEF)-like protein